MALAADHRLDARLRHRVARRRRLVRRSARVRRSRRGLISPPPRSRSTRNCRDHARGKRRRTRLLGPLERGCARCAPRHRGRDRPVDPGPPGSAGGGRLAREHGLDGERSQPRQVKTRSPGSRAEVGAGGFSQGARRGRARGEQGRPGHVDRQSARTIDRKSRPRASPPRRSARRVAGVRPRPVERPPGVGALKIGHPSRAPVGRPRSALPRCAPLDHYPRLASGARERPPAPARAQHPGPQIIPSFAHVGDVGLDGRGVGVVGRHRLVPAWRSHYGIGWGGDCTVRRRSRRPYDRRVVSALGFCRGHPRTVDDRLTQRRCRAGDGSRDVRSVLPRCGRRGAGPAPPMMPATARTLLWFGGAGVLARGSRRPGEHPAVDRGDVDECSSTPARLVPLLDLRVRGRHRASACRRRAQPGARTHRGLLLPTPADTGCASDRDHRRLCRVAPVQLIRDDSRPWAVLKRRACPW